jgi:glycosyltransferase involved in cell wall biosynthesis
MTNRRPRVSIGLPVYNGEQFLSESLSSILAQTFEDYELIISDNASTDRTPEICRAYAARDARVHYYRNATNLGGARNFNRVFELSSGEYFKWVAADDVCAPTFLARCVEALDGEPEAVLAYPRARCIDERGRVLHSYEGAAQGPDWSPEPMGRFRRLVDEYADNPGGYTPVYVFGLIRARALRQTHLIDDYMSADCNLLAELTLMGKFINVPEYLSFLRLHPGSLYWSFRHRLAKVREWYDPAMKGYMSVVVWRWRSHLEYFALIVRAPLGCRQKIGLLAHTAGAEVKRLRRGLGRQLHWAWR